MGKYDHILTKQADIQYKLLFAELAVANEANEANRLKRIELAMKLVDLPATLKTRIEAELQEDLDLEDQTG